MTRYLAGLGMAVTAAVGGSALLGQHSAGASVEMTLEGHLTNVQFATSHGSFLPGNDPSGSGSQPVPGDRIIIRDDMSQDGVAVGFVNIVCTVTFNDNTLCDGMYAIDGRGDIHFSALLRNNTSRPGPMVFDGVISGGTFNYRGSRGDIHFVNLPNGDTQATLNIV